MPTRHANGFSPVLLTLMCFLSTSHNDLVELTRSLVLAFPVKLIRMRPAISVGRVHWWRKCLNSRAHCKNGCPADRRFLGLRTGMERGLPKSTGAELRRQALVSPAVAGRGPAWPPTLTLVGIYRICNGNDRKLLWTDNGPVWTILSITVLEISSRT